eukprot:CAMPEP_0202876544 /NCGR_PEP_ID=MMETSP1391-20130828/29170_1 /ASSEMBLY_ACC=CAM_ASM_000867 /TAXON_ID=1034604 /ORGANISM="Chlamydomonas leiostraca, Strain SAG 11-49" /LENGTH=49 /DNA_ID= /DNA_START= /DNA_END= /DNA_ORIENTATION=
MNVTPAARTARTPQLWYCSSNQLAAARPWLEAMLPIRLPSRSPWQWREP